MNLTKETQWLCEHARILEKFSGQCVTFDVNKGLYKANQKQNDSSFVFHVPSKDELRSPMPVIRVPIKHV